MKNDHKPDVDPSQNLNESIQELDHDVKILDHDIKKANKANYFWPTLSRGAIASLGALLGATIIISAILYILQRLAVLPVIGEIFRIALDHLKSGKTAP
jgi:hypothetical protein